jgi:hypothetical protein
MVETIAAMLPRWEPIVAAGTPFDVASEMSRLTLDVVEPRSRAAYGVALGVGAAQSAQHDVCDNTVPPPCSQRSREDRIRHLPSSEHATAVAFPQIERAAQRFTAPLHAESPGMARKNCVTHRRYSVCPTGAAQGHAASSDAATVQRSSQTGAVGVAPGAVRVAEGVVVGAGAVGVAVVVGTVAVALGVAVGDGVDVSVGVAVAALVGVGVLVGVAVATVLVGVAVPPVLVGVGAEAVGVAVAVGVLVAADAVGDGVAVAAVLVGAGATVTHCENADVLLAKSVAVAVTKLPAGPGNVTSKLAFPVPSVARSVAPKNVSPSPKPDGSQAPTAKNSMRKLVDGALVTVPCMRVLTPSNSTAVSAGASCVWVEVSAIPSPPFTKIELPRMPFCTPGTSLAMASMKSATLTPAPLLLEI